MKKGHRRTSSESIALTRPMFTNIPKNIQQYQLQSNPNFDQSKIHYQTQKFSSIQSLLNKSEQNIVQRVIYIQNLQQPNTVKNSPNQFAFGKGVNYKLNNFKLNMGQIPQATKSNDSTSLQGEKKIQILQNDIYLTHQPYRNKNPSQREKQCNQVIKISPKHKKTCSAVGMTKNNNKLKTQMNQANYSVKNLNQRLSKQYYSKRNHFDLFHKKMGKSIKDNYSFQSTKLNKQLLIDRLEINQQKKKKLISLNQLHKK